MQVKMKDRLARIRPYVVDRAETMFKFAFMGDFCRYKLAIANQLRIGIRRLINARNMLLGNNQHMRRRLRIDVFKRKGLLVFIDLPGGDPARDNLAEKTVSHNGRILANVCAGIARRLIQSNQINSRICMRFTHYFLGAFLVVFSHAHTDPVPAHGTAELQHLGALVAAGKFLFQFCGIA